MSSLGRADFKTSKIMSSPGRADFKTSKIMSSLGGQILRLPKLCLPPAYYVFPFLNFKTSKNSEIMSSPIWKSLLGGPNRKPEFMSSTSHIMSSNRDFMSSATKLCLPKIMSSGSLISAFLNP